MSRLLDWRTLPLHCDAAEFGKATAFQDVLAVSMYELDKDSGKRNGMVCIITWSMCPDTAHALAHSHAINAFIDA